MQFGFPSFQKPPRGTLVDWTNPITGSMGGCYFLNENTGTVLSDACQNLNLSFNGSPTWSTGGSGISLASIGTSGSNGATAVLPSWLRKTGNSFTILMGVRRLGSTVQYGCLGGLFQNATNTAPDNTAVLEWNSTTGNLLAYYTTSATGNVSLTTSGSLDTTNDHVVGLTVGSGGATVYIDGAQSAYNPTPGYSGVPWGAASSLTLGYIPGIPNLTSNAQLYWFYWWYRALSATEIITLTKNPWQVAASPMPAAWLNGQALRPRLAVCVPFFGTARPARKPPAPTSTRTSLITGFPRGPLAVRIPTVPGRGRPKLARTTYTATPTPTPTPTATIGLNLAFDRVINLSNDLDPIAVDAALVVLLGNDSDPIAVDYDSVIWIK